MHSSLEIFDLNSGRRTVLRTNRLIEAPNWSPEGDALLVNGDGRLWLVPLAEPALLPVDTGPANRCNNDHGYSPDGRSIVLSSHHGGQGAEIYLMPRAGGQLQLISPAAPSWWHGFSPDGNHIVYAAAREGRIVDIYRRSVTGGPEQRLTTGEGHSDGPEFSTDGKWIYYNCDRSGHAQIWVMDAMGATQKPLFEDARVNWFPHPSPDGRRLIFLAYPAGTEGHPRDLSVSISICDPDGRDRHDLISFIGGQGTMNGPNWSPDGQAFAYVAYA